ncbi:MAG: hypothetical protein BWY61_01722 [Firmicutes bacterium ADurb.Bin354]|nr:MAG: hypothetical protein BWY61_01722 [Firmicutes bacterium ADurb.Bin354]
MLGYTLPNICERSTCTLIISSVTNTFSLSPDPLSSPGPKRRSLVDESSAARQATISKVFSPAFLNSFSKKSGSIQSSESIKETHSPDAYCNPIFLAPPCLLLRSHMITTTVPGYLFSQARSFSPVLSEEWSLTQTICIADTPIVCLTIDSRHLSIYFSTL